jgi:hypothetical protein
MARRGLTGPREGGVKSRTWALVGCLRGHGGEGGTDRVRLREDLTASSRDLNSEDLPSFQAQAHGLQIVEGSGLSFQAQAHGLQIVEGSGLYEGGGVIQESNVCMKGGRAALKSPSPLVLVACRMVTCQVFCRRSVQV